MTIHYRWNPVFEVPDDAGEVDHDRRKWQFAKFCEGAAMRRHALSNEYLDWSSGTLEYEWFLALSEMP